MDEYRPRQCYLQELLQSAESGGGPNSSPHSALLHFSEAFRPDVLVKPLLVCEASHAVELRLRREFLEPCNEETVLRTCFAW